MKFIKENWQPFLFTVAAVVVGLWVVNLIPNPLARFKKTA